MYKSETRYRGKRKERGGDKKHTARINRNSI